MYGELFRQLLLIFINIKAVLAGQQTLQQAIDGLVREITGLDVVAGLDTIKADVADIKTIVGHADFGNAKLATKLDLLTTYDTHTILAILDAIAALPAGSNIVIPPSSDNAEAVWLYQGVYRDLTGNMLSKLDETNTKLGPSAGYLAPATPWFGLYRPTSFAD
jgi:hypothetical protein